MRYAQDQSESVCQDRRTGTLKLQTEEDSKVINIGILASGESRLREMVTRRNDSILQWLSGDRAAALGLDDISEMTVVPVGGQNNERARNSCFVKEITECAIGRHGGGNGFALG